ncbi:MAG: rod shape-determining protein MreC [Pseudomonadota bacterium]
MPRWIKPAVAILLLVYLVIQILSFRSQEKTRLAPAERFVMVLASPLQNMAWSAVRGSVNVWQDYIRLIGVSRTNRALYDERNALVRRLSELKEVEQENRRLRGLMEFREREGLKLLFAVRIASGATPYERTIRVRRGNADGVKREMAVLHPGGVIGQVVEASGRVSDVLLLSDLNSAADGVIQRSRARGIVRGSGLNELTFEYLTKGDDIVVGDEVMTTGLDGIYPKGQLIGRVTRIEKDGKGLFVSARVKPSVDFSRLEEVAIVLEKRE